MPRIYVPNTDQFYTCSPVHAYTKLPHVSADTDQ